MFVFPGLGMGVHCAQASHVTDAMLFEAARTLADTVDDIDLQHGKV